MLSKSDQLKLLLDILNNQLQDGRASDAEYQQASRIIENLVTHEQLDPKVHTVLTEIENYCNQGVTHPSHGDYISSHKTSLMRWVQALDVQPS